MTFDDIIGKKFIQSLEYWDVEREITGLNGGGGFWIIERWKWKDGKTCREQPMTLSVENSKKLWDTGVI